MTSNPSTQLLTAREVADKLNVSIDTIYLWSSNGTLDAAKVKLGRRVRFNAEVIEQVAREGLDITFKPGPTVEPDVVRLTRRLDRAIKPDDRISATPGGLEAFELLKRIVSLRLPHHGVAIALFPKQRDAFKQALADCGSGEIAGPPPAVPSKHTGPIVLLDGSTRDVVDAEVLGLFGLTTIVLISDPEAA
jgi:excisionase family DNA binding protein